MKGRWDRYQGDGFFGWEWEGWTFVFVYHFFYVILGNDKEKREVCVFVLGMYEWHALRARWCIARNREKQINIHPYLITTFFPFLRRSPRCITHRHSGETLILFFVAKSLLGDHHKWSDSDVIPYKESLSDPVWVVLVEARSGKCVYCACFQAK